jgi:hypothetical protein
MEVRVRIALMRSSAVAALLATSPSFAASQEGWDWMVAPYLWGATVGTDLNARHPPADQDTDFPDLIDKLEGAFQVHIEGQGAHFGLFADYTYLGLGDSKNFLRVATSSDLDSQLFELAAVWSPGADKLEGLEVFGGLRYINVDLKARFDPVNPLFRSAELEADRSYSDLMLGARYTWLLGDRWRFTLRGDGSLGGTEGTWNASVVGQYRLTHGAWLFGYRYLSVEVEDHRNRVDITMNGPMVGYGFIF